MKRRGFLATLAALAAGTARTVEGAGPARAVEVAGSPAVADYPAVDPGYRLKFPRDHGAHPAYRTEWWYVTGWLRTGRGEDLGFQVTFFRLRPPYALEVARDSAAFNPSAFAPRQLLLAHAALAEPRLGRLRHDQRAARSALDMAGAAQETTRTWIDAWRLELEGARYRTRIEARDFLLALEFTADRPPLLQGVEGYSRKGPGAGEASHYYSRPGLSARGSIERGAGPEAVSGQAWLDHEWSSAFMPSGAVGWDWIGINLDDGGALMAFRMRGKAGEVLYAGGTLMRPDGGSEALGPREVEFSVLRVWRSPRSGSSYPVSMRVRTRDALWRIEPLFDDQELDSRASTATIYWEGAVRAYREQAGGGAAPAGRGYLELTGYWRALRL